ncbi:MAG: thioredoxin-disulfide reductase [Bacteroidota bacterium]|nr:thioredoxin-disulfide reductase [Bacteroidota bacterium]
MEHRKVIIIGSGPAGLTAALYSARANLSPLIFEGNQPGGQLTITTDVENYPGFPEGIQGPKLMDEMRKQVHRFGAESKYEHVTGVDVSKRPFTVHVGDTAYTADALIVSTGASAKLLGLESEKEYMGYGVSACATCDGFFFKDQEVAVIGGGDTAMEEALFLTKFATKVTVIHRRDELRASKIMQERALKSGKIEFKWNSTVVEVKGTEENGLKKLTHLALQDTITGELEDFAVQGLFIGIGHKPNTDLFEGILDMDENGYVLTQGKSTYTNVEGVFACGDVQDHVYRQAVSAAGSGCMASIDAERWLAAQGIE